MMMLPCISHILSPQPRPQYATKIRWPVVRSERTTTVARRSTSLEENGEHYGAWMREIEKGSLEIYWSKHFVDSAACPSQSSPWQK
ncbi:hypothetical protein EJB05_29120, partial [Eragrostis curvula]